jgi:hypothetical protein
MAVDQPAAAPPDEEVRDYIGTRAAPVVQHGPATAVIGIHSRERQADRLLLLFCDFSEAAD